MKKKNAIMLADTRSALIGHMLLQIKKTNPNLFEEVIIYYDQLSDKDKKIMNEILPCRFIKFNDEMPKHIKELSSFKKFSMLMFSRYYMFNLLNEYETITWIDTDVLIKDKLDSVIEKAKKTGMAANFEDKKNKSYLYTDTVRTSFKKPLNEYDMSKYNMSSGLISVSDTLKNYNVLTDWCFNKTFEYADNLVLPDQGVLNIMIQEFNIDVSSVGENGAYCFYPSYRRDDKKAKIIHAWGSRKFWTSWYLYNKYPQWAEYYKEWINMGGRDDFGEIIPEVSIVIPMYKPKIEYFSLVLKDLLEDQVQEHNFQYDNFEIILVVDGNENDSLIKLLNEYNDPRVKLIINEERAGIAKSINIGIKNAKGKYIARIDDDDRVSKHRLFKQVEFLNKNKNIDLVTSNYEYFGDMNEKRLSLEGEYAKAWSIFTCPFDHPTIMFRKKFFLDNNLFYDESRSHVEDWELWLRAFKKGMNVGNIPEILYYHRWYNGQAGQNTKTIEMMRELVKNNFLELNINLTEEDLTIVSPWQGMTTEEDYIKLEKIFKLAIENNKKLKLYSEKALRKVFEYRLQEAKTGQLKHLIINNENIEVLNKPNNNGILRKIRNIILKPIYKTFKRVIYNIVNESINDNMYYLIETIEKINDEGNKELFKLLKKQQTEIKKLRQQLENEKDK